MSHPSRSWFHTSRHPFPILGRPFLILATLMSCSLIACAQAGPRTLTVPASVSFNTLTTTPATSQTITLTNTGQKAIKIFQVNLTGSNPTLFSQRNTCQAAMPGGDSCTITLDFSSPNAGTFPAAVTLATNAAYANGQTVADNLVQIPLTGVAAAPTPVASFSTTNLTLASVIAGKSTSASVTLTNTGTAALDLSAFSLTGAGANLFADTSSCGATLAVDASCDINISFVPTVPGLYNATLNVPNSAAGAQSISLSGTAMAAPVSLTVNSTTDWQVSNGAIVADYDPTNMHLWSVTFNGAQLVDTTTFSKDGHYSGLYMDNVGLTGSGCTSNFVHVPATDSVPEYIDLWTTCPSSSSNPATFSLHYVFVSNDPGFHTYFTVDHAATDIAGSLGQIQWVFRDSWGLFNNTYTYNTGLNNPGAMEVPLPPAADVNTTDPGRQVSNAVVDLHGFTDVPAGFARDFYTKYDYAGYEYLHQAHGLYGSQYGLWGVFPSTETFNGGPTKQNLLLTGNLLTIDAFDSHFLPSVGVTLKAGTPLSRMYGPYYIRFNEYGTAYSASGTPLATPDDLYKDAVSAGTNFSNFYNNEATLISSGYVPTTNATRGSVSVQMKNVVGTGSTPSQYAWAVLSDNAANFQLSMNGAQYWADISSTGSATFTNVIPGTYRLSVYVLGQYGELRVDNISVTAGSTTVVPTQTFIPENFGKTLFTIGTPDRSSHEFLHGLDSGGHDLRNYWGSYNFWSDFAATNGQVIYYGTVVGGTPATNDTTKWNYTRWGKHGFDPGLFGGFYNSGDDTTDGYQYVIPAYVASLPGAKGTNGVSTVTPPWVVHFATPSDYQSYQYVTLSLSLACADGTVIAALNGNASYSWSAKNETDCMLRSGFSGMTQLLVFQFPASQLNTTVGGDNELTLSASGTGDSDDALRVELSNTNASPAVTGWHDYTVLTGPASVIPPDDSVPNP